MGRPSETPYLTRCAVADQLTIAEALERYQISESTLSRIHREHRVKFKPAFGRVRVSEKALRKALEYTR